MGGAKPAVPTRSGHRLVPFGLIGGAAVGLLLGVFLGAVALGIVLGAAVGLVAGSVIAGVAGTDLAKERPTVLWVALAVLLVGGLAIVLTWLG